MSLTSRDYQSLLARVAPLAGSAPADRMQGVVDVVWDAFSTLGVSWVGFYLADESKPESERLILGPRRDKPACSPIGLHGVCGAGYRTARTQIVRDVADLGPDYIACDPRDRSEIVVPITEADGRVTAVLDVDSFDLASFTEHDDAGLRALLEAAGFTVPSEAGAG